MWRDIETAPLREAVLIYHASMWTRAATMHEDGSWWRWPDPGESAIMYQPTHWSPFPDDPK